LTQEGRKKCEDLSNPDWREKGRFSRLAPSSIRINPPKKKLKGQDGTNHEKRTMQNKLSEGRKLLHNESSKGPH